jgi:hypothetical protein
MGYFCNVKPPTSYGKSVNTPSSDSQGAPAQHQTPADPPQTSASGTAAAAAAQALQSNAAASTAPASVDLTKLSLQHDAQANGGVVSTSSFTADDGATPVALNDEGSSVHHPSPASPNSQQPELALPGSGTKATCPVPMDVFANATVAAAAAAGSTDGKPVDVVGHPEPEAQQQSPAGACGTGKTGAWCVLERAAQESIG